MKFVYLGDIMGRSGREAALEAIPKLRTDLSLDAVVINGENAAGGYGINQKICAEFYAAGVDVITTGNHVWDQKETLGAIDGDQRLIRPGNFPAGTPGRGAVSVDVGRGRKFVVIQIMGRVNMDPLDDPFATVDRYLKQYALGRTTHAILVDIHGEATSEKMAMGHYCDGRVSAVCGTHTHIPTADAQIFPGGTAYQTDAGMCGDYDSVIGMQKEEPIRRFTRKIRHNRFEPALGPATVCGIFVETDDGSGLATRISPIRLGGRLIDALP